MHHVSEYDPDKTREYPTDIPYYRTQTFAVSQSEAGSTLLISCDIKTLT